MLHIFRKNPAARAWLETQPEQLSITPLSWMELMYGAPGKRGQDDCRRLLGAFEMVYLTREDMDWAMGRLTARRLSHGVAVVDCLIASVCQRLQVPLYSHNVGHMQAILGPELALKPY